MEKSVIIFVKSNLLDRDIRLPKEITALNKAGQKAKLILWDRVCNNKNSARQTEFEEITLRLKAPWGIKILLFLPIWWSFVFINLLVTKYDVIHAVNFDSIIPALIAGKLKKKPIVYEILDVYVDEIVLPQLIRKITLGVDKIFMRFSNAIIVADEMQIEGIGGIPNNKIVPIYDSPPNAFIGNINEFQKDNNTFTLFFAGVLNKARQLNLDKVIEAIKDIDGIKLIIAGYGDLVDNIKEWVSQMPEKVEFIGAISYTEVIQNGLKSDLFFILRDPIVPANQYTCGSTLFNAMICGKPILANDGSSTASKVRENNCGLVVNANDINQIKQAIIKLRDDPELCQKLGANARKAYNEKFAWLLMEQRLIRLYQEVVENKK